MKPRILVGYSVESFDVANVLKNELAAAGNVTLWPQGISNLTADGFTEFANALADFDMAALAFNPNDLVLSRNGTKQPVLLLLETTLQQLGGSHVYFVNDEKHAGTRQEVNALGATLIKYNPDSVTQSVTAAIQPVVTAINNAPGGFTPQQRPPFTVPQLVSKPAPSLLSNVVNFFKPEQRPDGIDRERVKALLKNKPEFWELQLAGEILTPGMELINKRLAAARKNPAMYSEVLTADNCLDWFDSRVNALRSIIERLTRVLEVDMIQAFAPPGIPANPQAIEKSMNDIVAACGQLVDWDATLLQTTTHVAELQEAIPIVRLWAHDAINKCNLLAKQFNEVLENAAKLGPGEKLKVSVKFGDLREYKRVDKLLVDAAFPSSAGK